LPSNQAAFNEESHYRESFFSAKLTADIQHGRFKTEIAQAFEGQQKYSHQKIIYAASPPPL
jgi:hypothetical protein